MSFKNTHLAVANLLQSKGNLLDLSQPLVMGIINCTPDSFFQESRKQETDEIVAQAQKMMEEGAVIVDIGGASTRPQAAEVSEQEEMDRVIPAIQAISKHFPEMWISVDTYRSTVAKAAIEAGARMVNDISAGLFDAQMLETIAALKVPYIAMHNRGTAQTMHQNPSYANITEEVISELQEVILRCHNAGIVDVILDPGFGFAKNIEHNFELLNHMAQLRLLGKPILAGISRKSMIYKSLNTDASNALNGTTALHMVTLQQGANILRVHDVREAVECIELFGRL
jgi:dihydropteroate synthase